MSTGREARVIDTFLSLTDTLVHDFDPVDMLTMLTERASELLDVVAAGVILTDAPGSPGLSVAAASSKVSRLLEAFAVAIEGGPCVECLRTGEPVICGDLTALGARHRWTRYAAGAAEAGFRAVHAVPMRRRGEVIGVLTLLHTDRHTLDDPDTVLAQALADAATLGLLHERAVRHAEGVRGQLEAALGSRVIIEQAKGVLSHQGNLTPEDAFTLLRSYARNHGMRLADLSRSVVAGVVDLTSIVRPAL